MMNELMFSDLLSLMKENLNEKLCIKSISDNEYQIGDDGFNRSLENFTQINFRVTDDKLTILWFYLMIQNKGIGSKVMKWLIEFCMENNITTIEIRNVAKDNEAMKKFLNKFQFEIITTGDFMDFRKIL